MPRMLLSILVVSYNTEELTLQTLDSVAKDVENSDLLRNATEVIVIDNDSTDNSVSSLKKLQSNYPFDLKIIQNSDNVGFAKANNQGIDQSKGQFVLLLNSDTIVQLVTLEQLVRTFNNYPLDNSTAKIDRLGILAATLLNQDGTIQPQGGNFPSLWSLFFQMTFLDDLPIIGKLLPSIQFTGKNSRQTGQETNLITQDWVGGTAMMIRREVFDEIGSLDQNIFMYAEDVEFCLRAAKHHWDVAIHPNAQVIHLQNASSSSERALIGEYQGYLYIWSKHKPAWQRPIARALLKLGAHLRVWLFGTMDKTQKRANAYRQILHTLNHA